MPLDLAHLLKPYIHATQAISMHFSQSKSTKCEVFAWHVFIFQEPLIIETQNLCHWIWHTSNPTYMPLKPFQCIFPCQKQQNVKFVPVYWTPPYTKWKKHQFEQGKSVPKGLKICTDRFFVCQSQCTISELCVTSTFSVMKVFLNFWQEGLGIGFWNMVYG